MKTAFALWSKFLHIQSGSSNSLDTSFREHLSATVRDFFDVSLGCYQVVVKLDMEQR